MNDDFKTDHLKGEALELANGIKAWLEIILAKAPYGGGCPAFHHPEEWVKMQSGYLGSHAVLVLVHDGGDLAPFCNVAYGNTVSYLALKDRLERGKLYLESINSVVSVVYRETEEALDFTPQPAPIHNPEMPFSWDLVRADMKGRDEFGERKYKGVRLQPNNGRDMLKDAYEEGLDLVVYLRGLLYERDGK